MLGQLLPHAFRISARLVNLIDCHHHRDTGVTGMMYGLNGLRLNAVVRRHDQYYKIRCPRAAGAHRSKRLMAGGVQKSYHTFVDLDVIGADVLRDSTRLTTGHTCFANMVQQRGLSVIDVPHDRDDRWARFDLRGRF